MIRAVVQSFFIGTMLTVCGCATTPRPPLAYQAGAMVDTLSANASLSVSKGLHGMSANGILLYQRPDKIRIVILTPFNTTMMEAVISGDRITIANSSEGVAYSGYLEDLPAKSEGEMWRFARWVMNPEPLGNNPGDGTIERINSMSDKERVTYENGLIISKSLANGDTASYKEYIVVNGVPLATEIIVDSHEGARFRIVVSEPEVNTGLSPDAFTPNIDGLTLYPLATLKKR